MFSLLLKSHLSNVIPMFLAYTVPLWGSGKGTLSPVHSLKSRQGSGVQSLLFYWARSSCVINNQYNYAWLSVTILVQITDYPLFPYLYSTLFFPFIHMTYLTCCKLKLHKKFFLNVFYEKHRIVNEPPCYLLLSLNSEYLVFFHLYPTFFFPSTS